MFSASDLMCESTKGRLKLSDTIFGIVAVGAVAITYQLITYNLMQEVKRLESEVIRNDIRIKIAISELRDELNKLKQAEKNK